MRGFVLALTFLFSAAAAVIWWVWSDSEHSAGSLIKVAPIGLVRLAMVMAALWLAWPTIRKPALWFPPGILLISLVAVGVCAIQPRLALALLPAVMGLVAFTGFLRLFRQQ